MIFVEITQPNRTSVDRAGMVARCIDKPAVALDQPAPLAARIRQLVAGSQWAGCAGFAARTPSGR
jgi:hypothetical protein